MDTAGSSAAAAEAMSVHANEVLDAGGVAATVIPNNKQGLVTVTASTVTTMDIVQAHRQADLAEVDAVTANAAKEEQMHFVDELKVFTF